MEKLEEVEAGWQLAYIWVDNFRCLMNFEINFSVNYHFEYDLDNKMLKSKNINSTNENFWGEKILNFSALVGRNGTGKSTVLNLLRGFLFNKNFKQIIIFQNKNKYRVFYSSDLLNKEGKFNNLDYIKIEHNSFINKGIKPVYVNLNLDLNNSSNFNSREFDLSTHNLIVKEKEKYPLKNYFFNELINQTKFLDTYEQYFKKIFKENIDVDSIGFIINAPFYFDYENSNDLLDKILKRETILKKLKSINKKEEWIKLNTDKTKKKEVFKILLTNLVYYIWCVKEKKDNNFINNKLKLDFTEHSFPSEIKDNIVVLLETIDFDNFIVEYKNPVEDWDDFKFKIKRKDFEKFNKAYLTFLKNVNNTCFETDFFVYSWYLSSGQNALLSFFARIYTIKIEKKNEKNNYQDKYKIVEADTILLLLDEPDSFLHPQWGKMFPDILLKMLKEMFPNMNFQIIFTTHSPLLLSDFSKENVILLDKIDDKIFAKNPEKSTFAQNIYTLYKDSFFIQDGFIGDFAKDKINSLIKFLKGKKEKNITWDKEKSKQFIEIIGETLIKDQLRIMWNKKFEKELHQLSKDELIEKIKQLQR